MLVLVLYCILGALVSYVLVHRGRVLLPRMGEGEIALGGIMIFLAGFTAYVLLQPYNEPTAVATGLSMDTIFRLIGGEIGPRELRFGRSTPDSDQHKPDLRSVYEAKSVSAIEQIEEIPREMENP